MYKGKYSDLLLDGRWKVIGLYETSTYNFENIYNHNIIRLSHKQIKSVLKGETTVSQIISRRIGTYAPFVDNRTVKGYHNQIKRHVKEKKL